MMHFATEEEESEQVDDDMQDFLTGQLDKTKLLNILTDITTSPPDKIRLVGAGDVATVEDVVKVSHQKQSDNITIVLAKDEEPNHDNVDKGQQDEQPTTNDNSVDKGPQDDQPENDNVVDVESQRVQSDSDSSDEELNSDSDSSDEESHQDQSVKNKVVDVIKLSEDELIDTDSSDEDDDLPKNNQNIGVGWDLESVEDEDEREDVKALKLGYYNEKTCTKIVIQARVGNYIDGPFYKAVAIHLWATGHVDKGYLIIYKKPSLKPRLLPAFPADECLEFNLKRSLDWYFHGSDKVCSHVGTMNASLYFGFPTKEVEEISDFQTSSLTAPSLRRNMAAPSHIIFGDGSPVGAAKSDKAHVSSDNISRNSNSDSSVSSDSSSSEEEATFVQTQKAAKNAKVINSSDSSSVQMLSATSSLTSPSSVIIPSSVPLLTTPDESVASHPALKIGEQLYHVWENHHKGPNKLVIRIDNVNLQFYFNHGNPITDGKVKVHLYTCDTLMKRYRIPQLYFYTSFSGVLFEREKYGYVAPSVLRYFEGHNIPANKMRNIPLFEKQDVILLGIWRTRCTKPRMDIVLLIEGADEPYVMKFGVPTFLKTRYCALDAALDETRAIKIFEDWRLCQHWHYDATKPFSVDIKNPIATFNKHSADLKKLAISDAKKQAVKNKRAEKTVSVHKPAKTSIKRVSKLTTNAVIKAASKLPKSGTANIEIRSVLVEKIKRKRNRKDSPEASAVEVSVDEDTCDETVVPTAVYATTKRGAASVKARAAKNLRKTPLDKAKPVKISETTVELQPVLQEHHLPLVITAALPEPSNVLPGLTIMDYEEVVKSILAHQQHNAPQNIDYDLLGAAVVRAQAAAAAAAPPLAAPLAAPLVVASNVQHLPPPLAVPQNAGVPQIDTLPNICNNSAIVAAGNGTSPDLLAFMTHSNNQMFLAYMLAGRR